ncbi:MAG: N-acetylglucosamine-6-phosphate deacetylase, partial [Varibaculum cambriense]|nr:N-acetylglucosamine-6-phosphate deacetylase [Varibaculum cambriense]
MTTIKGRVFDGFGNQIGSGLVLDGNQLAEVSPGTPDANWPLIVPGFVDVHCHGGGGFSFPDTTNPEEIATAIKAHRSGGTTALFASLVSLADPLPYIKALV